MILLIDNYDSFVYTLARYVGLLGFDRMVVRNDALTCADIAALAPQAIILSPGPGEPKDAGIMPEVITQFGHKIPILGICLGHQGIGEVYGGRVTRASRPMHGKTSRIAHTGHPVFKGIPPVFEAARYHSLIVDLPANDTPLDVIARTEDGLIMALTHKTHKVTGLQFHPESCLTDHGLTMMRNFFEWADVHPQKDRHAHLA